MFFLLTYECMYVCACVSIVHTSIYIHKQIYEIVQASTNPYFLSSHSERRRTISPTTTPPTKHSEKYPSVHTYVCIYVPIHIYLYICICTWRDGLVFYVRPCKCRPLPSAFMGDIFFWCSRISFPPSRDSLSFDRQVWRYVALSVCPSICLFVMFLWYLFV